MIPDRTLRRVATIVLALVALASGSACSSDDRSKPEASATKTVTVTPTATPTPTPSRTVDPTPTESEPEWNLPRGFPKVVAVSSLPDQVRSWYEMSGARRAVAIAPGVWTELQPGAAMEDAIASGVYDGFCSSKKAFERKWLDGHETGGTCW
jgi:hypothetical protein